MTMSGITHRLLLAKIFFWSTSLVFSAPLQNDQPQRKDWLAEGKKQVAEGHFAEAVAAFNQFKQTAPQDPRPYFFSGIALAEAGHLSAAEAER